MILILILFLILFLFFFNISKTKIENFKLRPLLITKPLLSYLHTPTKCQMIHKCFTKSNVDKKGYIVIDENSNLLEVLDENKNENENCINVECPFYVDKKKYNCYKC
jgi:hypothetical protein